MRTRFSDVAVGAHFEYNGSTWAKQSTRTASVAKYQRTFYFSANEMVVMVGSPGVARPHTVLTRHGRYLTGARRSLNEHARLLTSDAFGLERVGGALGWEWAVVQYKEVTP